jgi:CRP/FNR family transcriptional regulator, cyclic AMP receptor protein
VKSKRPPTFDIKAFLNSAGVERRIVPFKRGETVYAQGSPSDSVLYIQTGGVKLSVLSRTGREAVVALLAAGDFFGEGCLIGQSTRTGSATAVMASSILAIDKNAMVELLREEPALSDRFIAHLLTRNTRTEEDLVDQLFNSSEKRLARTLLLLTRYDRSDRQSADLPPVSQEMLADMIGTTRSRVNFFMRKFERLGFITYKNGLKVNDTLLTVVLHD